ncbi:hypothetical protein FE257_004620 [Aspergillus nanangensis]|uniref:Flagellin N-terminal domain-containing protein n=1 Tax=Aspergillus nanangensis TaxID=2582783 RepID=A0AAD4CYU4_ASPNN|nr:hypothetical protein FE257_004620 [Aspergillus nanangensis]
MTSQINGLQQAAANAEAADNLAQTVEGHLENITNKVTRTRSLMSQAANDMMTGLDLQKIQLEIDELAHDIKKESSHASYDGNRLFDSSGENNSDFRFQIGGAQTGAVQIPLDATVMNERLGSLRVADAAGVSHQLDGVDQVLDSLNSARAILGDQQNSLHTIR